MSRPHLFVENRGQIHTPEGKPLPQILYHLSGKGVSVSLTAQSMHYSFFRKISGEAAPAIDGILSPEKYETVGLDVQLSGANPSPKITAEDQQGYYENFYLQGCGKARLSNVHSYARIVYHDVYPHIDWIVYVPENGSTSGVKYDFIVHPGGNPGDIKLKYPDVSAVSLNSDGSLTASSELGNLQEAKPYSYIRESGQEVPAGYRLDGSLLSFTVQAPAGKTLVIDPQVIWATYYGGSGADYGYAAACDVMGYGYMAGRTNSTSNIATLGSHKTTATGSGDAFLAKFSRLGVPVWATYFGGGMQDFGTAIALDHNSGSLYLCGYTQSTDSIATSGSHQTTLNLGSNIVWPDGFIAKLNMVTGLLSWSTYYGGDAADYINAAVCDASGDLYVAGISTSLNGVATSGSFNTVQDGFVARFSASGVRQWGIYVGGTKADYISGICSGVGPGVFISGYTASSTGIATTGAHQALKADTNDAFLMSITPSGGVSWGSYYGGIGDDYADAIVSDAAGNIYLCGTTRSGNNISTPGSHQASNGGASDAFLAKFSSGGTRIWGTYYGGSGSDGSQPYSPAVVCKGSVDYARNRIWLSGTTMSPNAIATPNSYQDSLSSSNLQDAFLAMFDTSGKRIWASYLGGPGVDMGSAIACNASGDVYFCGSTYSTTDFVTPMAYQSSIAGVAADVFFLYLNDSTSKVSLVDVPARCAGDSFLLNYRITANGSFGPGNVFRVQLSNAAGMFSAPVLIGSLTTSTGGIIPCRLPVGISGTYKLRIAATNPSFISDTLSVQINPLPQPVIGRSGNMLVTGSFSSYQWYKDTIAISGATKQTYSPATNGQYRVTVRSSAGCIGTSAAFNLSNVGVSNLSFQGGTIVYPNPVRDVLVIEDAVAGTVVRLKNMLGQDAAARRLITSAKQEISTEALPAGVYMLLLEHPDGVKTSLRILKQ